MKMDPEWKRKWLEALRSGEYDQATGTLRTTITETGKPAFCCLGVLCELVQEGNPTYMWAGDTLVSNGISHTGDLPSNVAIEVGLITEEDIKYNYSHSDPYVREDELNLHLSEWNDVKNYSFKQIADLIEQNL